MTGDVPISYFVGYTDSAWDAVNLLTDWVFSYLN